jgi:hypothetical protein
MLDAALARRIRCAGFVLTPVFFTVLPVASVWSVVEWLVGLVLSAGFLAMAQLLVFLLPAIVLTAIIA